MTHQMYYIFLLSITFYACLIRHFIIHVEEAVHTAPVKRTRSRILRGPNVGPQLEGPRVAVEAGRSGRKKAGNPAESSQRREKHNSKERDRR